MEFGFRFEEPIWLLLIVPLILFLAVLLSRGANLSGRLLPLIVSVLPRSVTILFLAFALAEPVGFWKAERLEVAVLVDVSASSELRRDNILNLVDGVREALEQRSGDGLQPQWVLFSDRPRPVAQDELGAELAKPFIGETNLELALELAAGIFSESSDRRVVVISDGVQTAGNVSAVLERLGAWGIRLHALDLGQTPKRPEVLVADLIGPDWVFPEQAFPLEAIVHTNTSTDATASLRLGEQVVHREVFNLNPGVERISFTQRLPVPGEAFFEFLLEADNDTLIENNRLSKVVIARQPPRVLYLAGESRQAAPLAQVLRTRGIHVEVQGVRQLPADRVSMRAYDALILSDIPASDFQPADLESIARFVREDGGALVALGGPDSFGSGGYQESALEEILPVWLEPDDQSSVALVLLIDQSGSMQGARIELAKDASKQSLDFLTKEDYVGVIAFSSTFQWVVELQPVEDLDAIRSRISRITAEGGTNIYPALEEAHKKLRESDAQVKHVIILSDGRTPKMAYERLLAAMTGRGKITVSTIAVGTEADELLLSDIAAWGQGRFYLVRDVDTVPRIFAEETDKATERYLVEEPYVPVLLGTHEITQGIDFSSAPPLLGYVATAARPTAENLLVTAKGHPLLAYWRFGLGKVFAFTSDADGRWSQNWMDWEGFRQFWVRLIFAAASGKVAPDFGLEIDRFGKDIWLHFDSEDIAERDLLLSLRGEFEEIDIVASRAGPSSYRTWVPDLTAGSYVLTLRADDSDRSWPFTVPHPEEYRSVFARSALQVEPAGESGTAGLLRAEDLMATLEGSPTLIQYRLWPLAILLVLCVFLVDIGLRRVEGRFFDAPVNDSLSR